MSSFRPVSTDDTESMSGNSVPNSPNPNTLHNTMSESSDNRSDRDMDSQPNSQVEFFPKTRTPTRTPSGVRTSRSGRSSATPLVARLFAEYAKSNQERQHGSDAGYSDSDTEKVVDVPFGKELTLKEGKALEFTKSRELAKEELPNLYADVVHPRWKRELMRNYLQTFLITLVTATIAYMIIITISKLPWQSDEFRQSTYSSSLSEPYFKSPLYAVLAALTFITSLVGFVAVQFWSMFGWERWKTSGIGWVSLVMSLFVVGGMMGLWQSRLTYWWWYGDAFILAITYTTMCFAFGVLGYVQANDSTKLRLRERFKEGVLFTIAELIVAVASLIYGLWMMPVYSHLSLPAKMAWRALVHPAYFEFLVMVPTRMLIEHRAKRQSGSLNALQALTMVHAQSHILTMSTAMLSELGGFKETLLGVFLMHGERYILRSTVIIRDHAVRRLFRFKSNDNLEKYLLAMEMWIEIIMDNSATLFAPYMALAFLPLKDTFTFHYEGVVHEVTTQTVIQKIFIQLTLGISYDLVFLLTNTTRLQRLPFLRTWRDIMVHRRRFTTFLVYSMNTMGLLLLLWMFIRVPRAVMCESADPCSCFVNHPECRGSS
ncbi:uncharacterized protein SPPG_03717 [Spizellomyces punctatus DAOM BR117]|uniref:Transmembrane protein n=1 Tax=Spizellomyces punctatus (strain DAOM BR117) TaxID=645134 RepID=A0A0L0HHP1_SPIPD|nr:uncharacterized protein SPPG_03717 [Spizellomyces punctatus DAOM BR117]KND00593.1 hypothetical protein SPPG_03717 [Spizellomyces punctatus DAOM BR117]|eukprot:XP_016608632.1 hypothetical protein SPPG_03717 [Spizellomyces punctatus DAOM BR117]